MGRRHGRIGGSDLSALVGLSSFGKGPGSVYASIVDNTWHEANRYMRRGIVAEPVIREMYQQETLAELEQHPGVVEWGECFAASVDDIATRLPMGSTCPEHGFDTCGICYADIVGYGGYVTAEQRAEAERTSPLRPFPVDYKTASINSLRKWYRVDKVTGLEHWEMLPAYRVQLALYMAVFDLPRAELFVAFGKDRWPDEPETEGAIRVIPLDLKDGFFDVLRTKLLTLERDAEFENMILEAGRTFWRTHIVPRVPPLDYVPPSVPLISVTEAGDGMHELTDAELETLNRLTGVTVETTEPTVPVKWVEILPPDAGPNVHPEWKEVK